MRIAVIQLKNSRMKTLANKKKRSNKIHYNKIKRITKRRILKSRKLYLKEKNVMKRKSNKLKIKV